MNKSDAGISINTYSGVYAGEDHSGRRGWKDNRPLRKTGPLRIVHLDRRKGNEAILEVVGPGYYR